MNNREKLKQRLGLTDADFIKPAPQPMPWSQPFWDGAREGRLLLKTCAACGHVDHPPYLFCTECGSERSDWRQARGIATLAAFAVNTYGVPAAFIEDLPYVLAMVDLPEGPRMISNIVDCEPNTLRNGMALEVVFHTRDDGIVLPKWRPSQKGGTHG